VVTDFVGRSAEWDGAHGAPAELMTRDEIVDLRREGAHFGSHLVTHRAADGLSSRELVAELAGSRAALESWLGHSVQAFAAPHGVVDERLLRLAADCGYAIGFTTQSGFAALDDNPLRLPRIEVRGDWRLATFIDALRPLT